MPVVEAESGGSWTEEELDAFNIQVEAVTATRFFGDSLQHSSVYDLDPNLFTRDLNENYDDFTATTARYLGRLSTADETTDEGPIDTLVLSTLELLGYDDRDRIMVQGGRDISLTMDGKTRRARTDICLRHRPSSLFLILVINRTRPHAKEAEPQIIANAIAAFGFNNRMRKEANLAELDQMCIPCITMCGTRPTFYLVPITKTLENTIKNGGRDRQCTTTVQKCETQLGNADGMDDKVYRKLAISRFKAFKHLAQHHWEQFLEEFED